MKISDTKKIEQLAKENLSSLDKYSHTVQINLKISVFKEQLEREGIIEDDPDDDTVTQTEMIPMEWKDYSHVQESAAWLSCNTFDTVHCYVLGKNKIDGVIFIGFEKNIYASKVLFSYLSKLALDLRAEYIKSLKRVKKDSTKEDRADDYMSDWTQELLGRYNFEEWYEVTYSDEILLYVKQNFKTVEERDALLIQAAEVVRPFVDDSISDSSTLGEVRKKLFKKFPREKICQIVKELQESQEKDLILSFPYKEWLYKNKDDGDDYE